ncbi:hypothetical protein WS62_19310 [Burkholderia sp. ABCPW 14]|nr:hypothetical protein WS62_19310 [Burkholderia sp. ABCPW 14]
MPATATARAAWLDRPRNTDCIPIRRTTRQTSARRRTQRFMKSTRARIFRGTCRVDGWSARMLRGGNR